MKTYALSLMLGLLISNGAIAADPGASAPEACKEVQTFGSPDCCAHCGCCGCCEKYCRVVCEMKEVKKTVWVVKCEEFCPLMPNCPLHCEKCLESNDQKQSGANCEICCKTCNPCASLENRNYIPPKCGNMRTKKVLEKKEVTCKIPSYKCIVVYVCANCGSKCNAEKADQQVPAAQAQSVEPVQKTSVVEPMPVGLARLF